MKKGEKTHKCDSCLKSFYTARDLKRHTTESEIHQNDKFKCNSCDKLFSRSRMKWHYIAVHEGVKGAREKCDICALSVIHLRKHILYAHKATEDHKCDSCNKSFSLPSYLKTHIHTVHEGPKDYECDICNQRFKVAKSVKEYRIRRHGVTIR